MDPKTRCVALASLALYAGTCALSCFPGDAKKPNIAFITIDTLRADRLGCYGYEKIETPHIDSIANRGVLFSQFLSQVPITLPSHSSIFTGLNPHRHKVRDNGTFRLDDSATTLAEVSKDHGYATAAFVGSFLLDRRFGLDQGFDHYDDDLTAGRKRPERPRISQGQARYFVERNAEAVVESSLKWISENRDRRFFVWIHLYDPHHRYTPPEPFQTAYSERPYDGEVAYVDHALGRLFESLKSWGILDETLITISSDHGESLGEHGYHGHMQRLYEPTMRIPLILSYPPLLPRGRVVPSLVRSIDVMPTLLDILDIPLPVGMDGVSAVPAISEAGGETADLPAYGESLPRRGTARDELRSYRTGTWKYIRHRRGGAVVEEELFHLEEDPDELRDLSDLDPSQTAELSRSLDALLQAPPRARAQEPRTRALPKDEMVEKMLRSLGYAE